MQIWAVMTQKGGSGKTTIALHLAIAAESGGIKTVVVDADPQQSAIRWALSATPARRPSSSRSFRR